MLGRSSVTKRQWIYVIDGLIGTLFIGLIYSSFYLVAGGNQSQPLSEPATPKEPDPTLQGIDVSHYQGDVQWPVIAETFQFAFLKATEGDGYVDPRFEANLKGIRDTGIVFGAYHFFSPNTDALDQANHFINATAHHRFSLPPVLDIEIAPDGDVVLFQDGIQQWVDTIEQSTGCTPIIYSNKSFWNQYLKGRFSDYPLWISDYTTNAVKVAGTPWAFWQFSDQMVVDGISGPVDQSRYRGSATALKALGSCQA